MKWSWRIGTLAGIGIYVHATFPLLVAWVAVANYMASRSVIDAAWGIVIILAVFTIVVLHELGHALTARRYGIPTRDITLLPIGGLARLERMPDKPVQELLVALAGPAVNVVLAVFLFAVLLVFGRHVDVTMVTFSKPGVISFLSVLLSINVILAAFNMLPAFPMDGGRVLRAILAMKLDYVQATQIAATIGQVMAFLVGFVGLILVNFWLIIIAIFIWMGAGGESSLVQIKSALGGIPVSHAMIREFHSLSPQDSLERAVEHILAGFQQDFPIEQDGRLVGVLTRNGLLNALAKEGRDGFVGDAMDKHFETADPYELLDRAFSRLQNCNCRALPVTRDGHVVGILTMDNVGEFMMVQSALKTMPAPRVPQ